MSKKNAATSGITHARIRTPDGRHISAASAFPADQHVATNPQRDLPNPAVALAGLAQPSERARLRAAMVSQEQRDSRARREAQQIVAAAERPAPTVREDLQAVRRRPIDAPMATPVNQLPQPPAPMIGSLSAWPDPLATLAWEAVTKDAAATARAWWTRLQAPLAFTVWSIGCFLLGRLAS